MGKQIANQSDASKAIKRINERMAELNRLEQDNNRYIAAYSRAIRESGVEFTKQTDPDKPDYNRYKIKNTEENRKKAEKLEKLLVKYKAKTVGDIRTQAKKELTREAKAVGEKRRSEAIEKALKAGKTSKEAHKAGEKARKEYIKEHTKKKAIDQRIKENLEDATIRDMLDVIYQVMGDDGRKMGNNLRKYTRGISWDDQNEGDIYDEHGRIREAYRAIQRGELIAKDQQRKSDNKAFYRNFKRGE